MKNAADSKPSSGSFGAFPRPVQDAQRIFQMATESSPDQFLRYDSFAYSSVARNRISQLLNTTPSECVFVQNATLGLNTVLRNLIPSFAPSYENGGNGEADVTGRACVVYFDTIYGAIEKTLLSLCETHPYLELRKVTGYTLPCTHKTIVSALLDTLNEARKDGLVVRVCVFETITSMPAARFPFEEITQVCREKEILSVIDGAHGVGQIHFNLRKLNPDFFVSNCHKWLYTPRGCAVLFVPKRNQHFIRTTLPTSWGFLPLSSVKLDTLDEVAGKDALEETEVKSNYFTDIFSYVGTADNTAFYCVPAALDFRQNVCGGEADIYEYITWIGQRGAELVAEILGTEIMDTSNDDETRNGASKENSIVSSDIRQCAMANVLLPFNITFPDASPSLTSSRPHFTPSTSSFTGISPIAINSTDISTHTSWLTSTLINEYHISVAIYTYASNIWLRVSGQIYLELSDFERFAKVLKEVLERLRITVSLKNQGNGDMK